MLTTSNVCISPVEGLMHPHENRRKRWGMGKLQITAPLYTEHVRMTI